MKPASMKKFDWLYLGSVAVGLLGFALNYGAVVDQTNAELAASGMDGAAGGLLIGGMLFGVAVNLALWFLISVLRIGFVKWIVVIFVAWGALSLGFSLASGQTAGLNLIFGLIGTVMVIASLYFLFRPESTAWLASRGESGDASDE